MKGILSGLTLAQRETLFVWTILTTNEKLSNSLGLSVKDFVYLLQPLSITADDLVEEAFGVQEAFTTIRAVFTDQGLSAAKQGDIEGEQADGAQPWDGESPHPLIVELREIFGL